MKCHICIYWTPEKGCNHYMPDSRTVIEMAGYRIQNLPDKGKGAKFKVTKGYRQGWKNRTDNKTIDIFRTILRHSNN